MKGVSQAIAPAGANHAEVIVFGSDAAMEMNLQCIAPHADEIKR
jgi:hypothetical protein